MPFTAASEWAQLRRRRVDMAISVCEHLKPLRSSLCDLWPAATRLVSLNGRPVRVWQGRSARQGQQGSPADSFTELLQLRFERHESAEALGEKL